MGPLKSKRFGAEMINYKDNIYIFGGKSGRLVFVEDVEQFDEIVDRWIQIKVYIKPGILCKKSFQIN
jgi:hypothetical protein